jgi:hypothetical protein
MSPRASRTGRSSRHDHSPSKRTSALTIALQLRFVPYTAVYYQPREQLGPRILLTLPVGIVLGIGYAFVSCLITQVFESSPAFVVATPIFGGVIAAAGSWVADRAQVRSRKFRFALAVALSAIALYVSWQAYLVLVDLRIFDFTPTWTMSPVKLVHGLVELANSNGRWWSWFWWLVEVVVVVSMVVYLMRTTDIEVPFCERCNAWTKVVLSFELADGDARTAGERLVAGDAAALATMRPRPRGEDQYAVVRVYRCKCGYSRYVSLDRAQREAGKSAGLSTYHGIGSRPSLYFDLGSSDTTDLTPVVTNLEIDEPTEQALATARNEIAKRNSANQPGKHHSRPHEP